MSLSNLPKFPRAALPFIEPEDPELAYTLPAFIYTDPAFVEVERQVLADSWQFIAHASQLQKAGDHVVSEVAGKPVLVVRNNEGRLNGFHNVCRHRAGPIATENGNRPHLSCRYTPFPGQ